MRDNFSLPTPFGTASDPENLLIADPVMTGMDGNDVAASGEPAPANVPFGLGAGGFSDLFAVADQFDFNILETALAGDPGQGSTALDAAFIGDMEAGGILLNEGTFSFNLESGTSLLDQPGDHGLDLGGAASATALDSVFSMNASFSVRGGDVFGPSWQAWDAAHNAQTNVENGPGEPAAGQAPSGDSGDAGIASLGDASAAKGGTPGAPGGGGGGGGSDGGGTSDPGVVDQWLSGYSDGDLGYDIWVDFKGSGWTVDLQQAFKAAADYFTSVITDDIGGGGLYRGKTIDDLYVTAEIKAIDGSGGVLGQAGPTAVWTANDLTATGMMQFDVADADYFLNLGLWDDIVTHEMMHVLGFGSLWDYGSHVGLVSGKEYTGDAALAAYQATVDPTADHIPVETDGGSGTAGSHWDEQDLGNELMTGYINNTNILSAFSVMALADLGYKVDYQDYPFDGVNQPYDDGVSIIS